MSEGQPPMSRKRINTRGFLDRHLAAIELYQKLKTFPKKQEYLTANEARDLGIEFSRFELSTSATPFFRPASEYQVAETGITSDAFREYPFKGSSLAEALPQVYNDVMGQDEKDEEKFEDLVHVFMERARALYVKFERPSVCVLRSGERWSEIGTIFRNAKATAIHDAEQFKDLQAPHRVIVISSTSSINEEEISISELVMLISWMMGGMWRQAMELKKKGVPYHRYHMLFPVLVISFIMKAHARIIQGYFDDDKLKVRFTEAHNFDVDEPGYTATMNSFLKWAGAVPHGDTRLLERYPIDELVPPGREAEKAPSSPETKPSSGEQQATPSPLSVRPGNVPLSSQPTLSSRSGTSSRGRGRGRGRGGSRGGGNQQASNTQAGDIQTQQFDLSAGLRQLHLGSRTGDDENRRPQRGFQNDENAPPR